ncbi:MAG TPA: type 4a pilus biogenesis protein PilO [Candidatus Paceibacterota bacterium]
MRTFIPILLIIAAIGLFAVYTNPAYGQIQDLQTQLGQYNDALMQSAQVRQMRDKLLSRRNTFSSDDIRKLERLLPDNVDTIRLIIDINDIAARHNLPLTNISVSPGSDSGGVVGGAGAQPVGIMGLSFTVVATYDGFKSFLEDLQRSLRLVDVEHVKFDTLGDTASMSGAHTHEYTVNLQTYWLRRDGSTTGGGAPAQSQ